MVCVAGSESVRAEWGPGCCFRYWAQQTLRETWLLVVLGGFLLTGVGFPAVKVSVL